MKLDANTAVLASGSEVVVAFVNDDLNKDTIDILQNNGVKLIAMRSAGYNNVDVKAAWGKIHIVRVRDYSPYAVAEHAMALLLGMNRKIHRAYYRIRDYNFSINGLIGFDLYKKTIGVVGTGKIGKVFIDICKGFGMNVIAYDLFQDKTSNINYVSLDNLYKESDIISLHLPLTEETKHIINNKSIKKMKDGVCIINTSRGALIDTNDLIEGLKSGKIKGVGLDVYEEEDNLFFEDLSSSIVDDDNFSILVSLPNVLITAHQAFLTEEALNNIAKTTLNNIDQYYNNEVLVNEVCYMCKDKKVAKNCIKNKDKRCF